ncbi:hypothetical protein DXG03_000574 [Asterophora parasitica]|uniref:Uncharacterized protein n=1 Tax=Asterophora parasitica TaxID=117018 RepID=A0A9P7KAQ5_9AGAR|nr:hypothetical protein DXG03_000574 [Asterophora parasitica]
MTRSFSEVIQKPIHKFSIFTIMSSNASFSLAIEAASVFLARPLRFNSYTPTTILAIQMFLQSALAPRAQSNLPILLSFTLSALPPLQIQLACVAFGIKWAGWLQALGGSAFDLVIEPTRVYVIKKSTGQFGVIWASKSREADVACAILLSKTPIAPIYEDESEKECSEAEFDAQSSRPSSRSSNLSDSPSVFSVTSSHSSASSVSSIASAQKSSPATKPPTPTYVPTPKAGATKYLYQGGVSTVLTGGVMLGGGPRNTVSPKAAPVPVVAPAPTPSLVRPAVYTPPHRARTPAQAKSSPWARKDRVPAASASVDTWRRAGPLRTAA